MKRRLRNTKKKQIPRNNIEDRGKSKNDDKLRSRKNEDREKTQINEKIKETKDPGKKKYICKTKIGVNEEGTFVVRKINKGKAKIKEK